MGGGSLTPAGPSEAWELLGWGQFGPLLLGRCEALFCEQLGLESVGSGMGGFGLSGAEVTKE